MLFALLGQLSEFGSIQIGHAGAGAQAHGDDLDAGGLVARHDASGGGLDALGEMAGAAQGAGQGHAVAGGVGGGDEFFRVGAGGVAKAGSVGVGHVDQRAAGGGDGAVAGARVAVPDDAGAALEFDHADLLFLGKSVTRLDHNIDWARRQGMPSGNLAFQAAKGPGGNLAIRVGLKPGAPSTRRSHEGGGQGRQGAFRRARGGDSLHLSGTSLALLLNDIMVQWALVVRFMDR